MKRKKLINTQKSVECPVVKQNSKLNNFLVKSEKKHSFNRLFNTNSEVPKSNSQAYSKVNSFSTLRNMNTLALNLRLIQKSTVRKKKKGFVSTKRQTSETRLSEVHLCFNNGVC